MDVKTNQSLTLYIQTIKFYNLYTRYMFNCKILLKEMRKTQTKPETFFLTDIMK